MKTYAYIDASNLFYGGRKSLGWSIDFEKLHTYLQKRFNVSQVHFYQKLERFGFQLILKPVKIYEDEEGNQKRKANCDVEMAFYMMRDKNYFKRVVILSGDGDFLPVLKYLREVEKKEVLVVSRGPRTAKEIKQFAGDKFINLISVNMRARLERINL